MKKSDFSSKMYRSIVVISCIIALVQLDISNAFCIAILKNLITNHESTILFHYEFFNCDSPKENIENSTEILTHQQENSTTNLPSTNNENSTKEGMTTSKIIWCSVAIASIIATIIVLILVILDFRKIKAQQKQAIVNKAKALFKPQRTVPNQYVV